VSQLRIFLADDHPVVREGLKTLINSQSEMIVVGEAADGEQACQQVPKLKPDVVIMDVSMPGLTGSQATAKLRQDCPTAKIVVLTVHEDKGYVRQLLTAGAAGYVLKRAAPAELIQAIRSVAAGGTYIDPVMATKVMVSFVRKPSQSGLPITELSDREADVAKQTAAGYSNKEIAAKLELSIKTVETYRARAMDKLGLQGRASLVRYAVQQGWLMSGV
jgi:DNA-binding NarL/FixJ family response regulator